ncbi:MAG: phytanoyl-CoA dioxygenase [Candidatus Parabeggiatoa sp. nov. 1]|nr:MAG: phytanoyl-CoA dioxygenase [Gammaproteobacteria bacterium]
MHPPNYFNKIAEDGFAIIPRVISNPTVNDILTALDKVRLESAARIRRGSVYAIRDLLNEVPSLRHLAQQVSLRSLVEPLLGKKAKVVRAIFFDKTREANWKVTWHQDLTIAVQKRCDVDGFGPWSEKAGILHVQPPVSVLENMLTLRIHLDDCTAENGALSVIPGSHRRGRMSHNQIQALRQVTPSVLCTAPTGGVMVMRPLLLHASAASLNPSHRRILHFEYAANALPEGLEWYEA